MKQTVTLTTAALPVVTEEIAKELSPSFYTVAIGSSADVLGPNCVSEYELRVWRKQRTLKAKKQIKDFLRASFEVFGNDTGRKLFYYFSDNDKTFGLSHGVLVNLCKSKPVLEDIVGLYLASIDENINFVKLPASAKKNYSKNCRAFAEDFVHSLTEALSAMPSGTTLKGHTFTPKCDYYFEPKFTYNEHTDGYPTLQAHVTDPGTPYLGMQCQALYRTAGGDITAHGSYLWHGFATAEKNGDDFQPRVTVAFWIKYPMSLF